MYPRIILASAKPDEARHLAKRLHGRGIFPEVMTFDELLSKREPSELIIIMSRKYSSKAYACFIHAKTRLGGVKTLCVGNTAGYTDAEIDRAAKYTSVDKDGCISDAVSFLLGRPFTFAELGYIASDLSSTPFLYFRGTRIFLTDTEHYLVHAIASYGSDEVPTEALAKMMCLSCSSISSYASSINRKTQLITGKNMLYPVRNIGYSLCERAKVTK